MLSGMLCYESNREKKLPVEFHIQNAIKLNRITECVSKEKLKFWMGNILLPPFNYVTIQAVLRMLNRCSW